MAAYFRFIDHCLSLSTTHSDQWWRWGGRGCCMVNQTFERPLEGRFGDIHIWKRTVEKSQTNKVEKSQTNTVEIQPLFRSEVRMALRYFLSLESRRVNVTQDKPAVFLVTSWSVCVAILLPYFGLQCGFSQFNSELQSQLMLDTEQLGQCGFPVALQWSLKLVTNWFKF